MSAVLGEAHQEPLQEQQHLAINYEDLSLVPMCWGTAANEQGQHAILVTDTFLSYQRTRLHLGITSR